MIKWYHRKNREGEPIKQNNALRLPPAGRFLLEEGMELIELPVNKIKPYEKNPRKNDGAVEAVAESIKQCGYIAPIIVDEGNVVLAGHTRLKALKKLGYKKVPVVIKEGLSEEQKRKYRLLDNKTNELAEWDFDLLGDELEGLDFGGLELNWGIDAEEEKGEIIEDVPPEVDESSAPVSNLGDMWMLGSHRLMCGDSTNTSDVDKLMNGEKADLFVTDPPYNVSYEGKTKDRLKIQNDDMCDSDFQSFLRLAFENANSALRAGGGYYIWHADSEGFNFRAACNALGWKIRECLIWVKNSIVLGRQDYQWKHEPCLYGWKDGAPHYFIKDRTQSTVWEFNKPLRNGEHPTMKPVELIAKSINNSTRSGENVLDLFGGSGTTLIACEQLNRRCFIMEIDPKYCDVIIKRWENFSGKKAVKINV